MGAEKLSAICEGQVEKKVEHRRLPIMPLWKRKYGVLDSEALRLYRNKTKMNNGDLALRTIPLCHIKTVSKVYEDEPAQTICFNLFTEQGEVLTFRSRSDVGWVAQIQIQLIHYKVSELRFVEWTLFNFKTFRFILKASSVILKKLPRTAF